MSAVRCPYCNKEVALVGGRMVGHGVRAALKLEFCKGSFLTPPKKK